jgi:Na+-driven multidrug efflux pump
MLPPDTKMRYAVLCIMAFVPLAMVLLSLSYLPDPLPAHLSLSGDVNRWGSRYEAFLLPVITIIVALPMIWFTKFSWTKDDHAGKLMMYATVGTLMLMIVLTTILIYIWVTH